MGYWVDADTYQYDDEREFMASIGLDPDTIEGDYAEGAHHMQKIWNRIPIDNKFNF